MYKIWAEYASSKLQIKTNSNVTRKSDQYVEKMQKT